MHRASNSARVDAVVIGRNEGARLIACLQSLQGKVRRIVYVDSGSTDGSADTAAEQGAEVIALDMSIPFTAARARNAGLAALADRAPEFVQFIDGDCTLSEGWIDRAADFLDENLRAAVACGRRRERHPEASIYNRLCDAEWDTPVGETRACGGDAMIRHAPLAAIGGFREDLIAGEEPELCLRLRGQGWTIWRLDAEMTLHDAAIHRFSQWWRRTARAGHAFAEAASRFDSPQQPFHRREYRRILAWGVLLPLISVMLALVVHPSALLLLLAYPVQVARLTPRLGFAGAFFNTLGKFAEASGVLRYHLRRWRGHKPRLIEYK
ncbi:MAG: putative glycosyltransferase [Rhodobacteraceae bacterium HLUCCA12]|nr:MAG: putative glycosyltransferase [Rhodobacteraceae bacterium HLUCCA12]